MLNRHKQSNLTDTDENHQNSLRVTAAQLVEAVQLKEEAARNEWTNVQSMTINIHANRRRSIAGF